MDIKEIIESINKLSEDAVGEDILTDIPEQEPEVAPAFNDGMSLADTLDAKTKIARCLENLKQSVEDFKEATAEKVDLLKDELLLGSIEHLGEVIQEIELALASGSNILGSELNDPFKTELPAEPEQPAEETEEEPDEEEEEDVIYNFDDEAGYDLLAGGEEE